MNADAPFDLLCYLRPERIYPTSLTFLDIISLLSYFIKPLLILNYQITSQAVTAETGTVPYKKEEGGVTAK